VDDARVSGAAASRRAVVTGAGSATGIGYAVARVLGRTGMHVVIVSTTDRIHERAADLRRKDIDATGVACDLTSEAGVAALVAATQGNATVDVLVNNAGMAVLGEMESLADLAQVSLEQ
jgi:3-oxoacyl-[acyl-carrier protein] reductase